MVERNNSEGDPFEEYRTTDVQLTSGAADGFTLDVNGTQVFFKQREHVPVLFEVWIEDEEQPLGAINVAKGCTVALGGVSENLAGEVETQVERLENTLDSLGDLKYRLNPEGQQSPQTILSRPGETRFLVVCECGEKWGPHKGADYDSRYSGDPYCPFCGTDWRELPGAERYTTYSGDPAFTRNEDGSYELMANVDTND